MFIDLKERERKRKRNADRLLPYMPHPGIKPVI